MSIKLTHHVPLLKRSVFPKMEQWENIFLKKKEKYEEKEKKRKGKVKEKKKKRKKNIVYPWTLNFQCHVF